MEHLVVSNLIYLDSPCRWSIYVHNTKIWMKKNNHTHCFLLLLRELVPSLSICNEAVDKTILKKTWSTYNATCSSVAINFFLCMKLGTGEALKWWPDNTGHVVVDVLFFKILFKKKFFREIVTIIRDQRSSKWNSERFFSALLKAHVTCATTCFFLFCRG